MTLVRSLLLLLRRADRFPTKAAGLLTGDFSRIIGGPVEESVAARIRAEQMAPILRYSTPLAFANLFNIAVLIAALRDIAPPFQLGLWSACMLVAIGRIFARRFRERRPAPSRISQNAVRKAVVNGFMLGAIWGAVPALFLPIVPGGTQVVLACITVGMVGGGAFALASLPSAALAMLLPILAGSIYGVLAKGGPEAPLIIVLVGVYCAVLIHGVLVHGLQVAQSLASTVEIERIARSDALTNLANRAAFREAIQAAELRHQRAGEPCALLFVDLDHFKTVNDTHGHAAGDTILVEAARRLVAHTRKGDLVARLGGDELAVLVSGLDSPATTHAYAARLVDAFRAPFEVDGKSLRVSISIGAAICSAAYPGGTRAMLHHADVALYRAKAKGRDAYHVYRGDEQQEVLAADSFEHDLRSALVEGGLSLVFQPIFHLEPRRLVGFEALLRWQHPIRGWITPAEILTLAEERDLSEALGAWVLREACLAAACWPRHLRLSVKVSPSQLKSRAFVTQVAGALSHAGLDPDRLDLEVPEAALVTAQGLAADILASLRETGVSLTLDDFSASYSMLAHLRTVTFDRVKIDGSLVQDVATRKDSQAMLRAMGRLAEELSLEMMAEDVETEAQVKLLAGLGCAQAQGFHLGEPVAALDLPAYLATVAARPVALSTLRRRLAG